MFPPVPVGPPITGITGLPSATAWAYAGFALGMDDSPDERWQFDKLVARWRSGLR